MDLLDILSGAGYVLDTPGALLRGVLSGRPGERKSGREMLESWGALGANKEGLDAGDIAGFLADVVADPLNLVGGGALARLLGSASKIRKLNKIVMSAPKALPSSGFVHGAPIETVSKYLKEGIPITKSEEGPVTFLARLDHPAGYQGSMTAVGGFGPRTKFSSSLENHVGIGQERFGDRVAYGLSGDIPAARRDAFDSIDDMVENTPEMAALRERSGGVIKHADRNEVLRQIRPRILEQARERGLFDLGQSHRANPEAIVTRELADQGATPEQIMSLIYDGPLTNLISRMRETGRNLPIYDSLGSLRARPGMQREPDVKQLLAALMGYNAAEQPYHALSER